MKEKPIDITGLRSAVQSLGAEHKRLSSGLESLKRKREDIASAPASRQDILIAVESWIDAQADAYRNALGERLRTIGRKAENLENGLSSVPHHLTRLLGIDSTQHSRADVDFSPAAAVVFLVGPDVANAAFRRVIQDLQIPNEGLPLAKRRAELDKLDSQIGAAEEQLVDLRREAAEAGIHLDAEAA